MTNENAMAVIDAYLEAEHLPVPHAILVEGPWGSGKTYFLEKIYEPHRQKLAREERLYKKPLLFVSLFGATSASEVEKRMHKAASPVEVAIGGATRTAVSGLGEVFKVKDAVNTTLDWIGKKAARRHTDYILVFDDLERAQASVIGEIMGLVNSLITTNKRRVILVGDEAKLLDIHETTTWKEQNEKIIGRRVRIEPDFESVIRTSISTIENEATKIFMTERFGTLAQLAKQSDVVNLRNLSWAVANGARFIRALLMDPEIPSDHVARTMCVVVATTLWYRSGKLDKMALFRLPNLSMALRLGTRKAHVETGGEDPEPEAAERFSKTFAEFAVESPPLDYRLIVDFEANGVLEDEAFVAWTKAQFGFGHEHNEPSWRRLWRSYERPMAETDSAIEQLGDELSQGKYIERGQILHCAGLAIKLDKAGNKTLTGGEDIVPFFKAYIDSLFNQRTLQRQEIDPQPLGYDAYGGLGFSSLNTAEFAEICSHLDKRQNDLRHFDRKERADAIVREAESGQLEALYKLNRSNDEISRVPVLIDVDVERMAVLITRDVNSLNIGARLLAFRYHHAKHGEPLLSEITWAREVYETVLRKIAIWPGHHRLLATENFQNLIRYYEEGRHPQDQIIPQEATAQEVNSDEDVGDGSAVPRP